METLRLSKASASQPLSLRQLTADFFQKAGTNPTDAQLLADLLTATDLRGVHSHGTWQIPGTHV